MVENYLGDDIFRAGIRAYMKQHAYSNTTTADLWGALQAASGKPVTAVAAAYTEQGGIPLVIAQASCAGDTQRITLRQERFTVHDPAPQPQRWQVPVARGGGGAAEETVLLRRRCRDCGWALRRSREAQPGRCGLLSGPI
jgi:aminopeptidase N